MVESAQQDYSTPVYFYKKKTVKFTKSLLLSNDKKAVERIWKEGIRKK